MRIFWLTLLLSFQVQAHGEKNEKECAVPIPSVMSAEDLQYLKEKLEWWGASTTQLKNAPCKTKNIPLVIEMDSMVSQKDNGQDKSETVHGVRLKNESPALIQAFKDLTTRRSMYGGTYFAADEPQTPVQTTYSINPACEKVLCAVQKIWGASMGRKILHMYLKHGYNGSELAFDNSGRFNEEELDDVLMTLDDLPPRMQPLGERKNQRLVPFTPGYTLASYDENVLANAGIIVFDSWRAKDRLTRQYTMFHEFAHNMSDRNSNADESSDWLKLSGWKKVGEEWKKREDACVISKYGETNPYEDFAEVATAYRYNAAGLESKCPQKYAYMRDRIFKGVEYKTAEQCQLIPADKMARAHQGLNTAIAQSSESVVIESADVSNHCRESFSAYPVSAEDSSRCAFNVLVDKLSQSEISKVLTSAGIADTVNNRQVILEKWKMDASDPKLNQAAEVISRHVDAIVLESQQKAEPKNEQLPEPNDFSWYSVQRSCGVEIATTSNFESCYVSRILAESQKREVWNAGYFPRYQVPPLFMGEEATKSLTALHQEAVKKKLPELASMQVIVAKAKAEFRKDMSQALEYVRYQKENSMPANWKSLPPAQFCSMTYGMGSVFSVNWGLGTDVKVPRVQEYCETVQATKSKRFFIKDEDLKKWVSQSWP